MAIETILVFGEGDDSGPSGLTLELLAAARGLASNIHVFVAGDAAPMAFIELVSRTEQESEEEAK